MTALALKRPAGWPDEMARDFLKDRVPGLGRADTGEVVHYLRQRFDGDPAAAGQAHDVFLAVMKRGG